MPDSSEIELNQKRVWHGINNLALRDQRALKVTKTAKIKTISYQVDILALDSKSRRVYSIAWKWLLSALLLSLLTYLAVTFPDLLGAPGQASQVIITVLLAIAALVGFVFSWLSTTRKQVFYTRHGHIPLIEIWVGQPSGKAFRSFVKLLTENIEIVQQTSGLTQEQQLTGEMKMLRRLADQNVLSKDVYERAKTVLFEKF